jgi:hypothetical protein
MKALIAAVWFTLLPTVASADDWSITDLGALGPNYNSPYQTQAFRINNSGQVVGQGVVLINSALKTHYVIWSSGTQIDLGVRFPGAAFIALSDTGQAAGVIEADGEIR